MRAVNLCLLGVSVLALAGPAEAQSIHRLIRVAISNARDDSPQCRRQVLTKLLDAQAVARSGRIARAQQLVRSARLASLSSCSGTTRRSIRRADGAGTVSNRDTYHNRGRLTRPYRGSSECSTGESCYQQAKSYGRSNNYRAAYNLFRRACKVYGHVSGCVNQGYYRELGRGVRRDVFAAARLYRHACKRGQMVGCNNLGHCYLKGLGVAVNRDKAMRLFRRACRNGAQKGCDNMRSMTNSGGRTRPHNVYRSPMPYGAFGSLKKQVSNASFSRDKIGVISTAARRNNFSCSQVRQLLNKMSFSSDKIKALRALAPRIVDKQNAHTILTAFSFSSDKNKARQILN